jgi:hypothetical protein
MLLAAASLVTLASVTACAAEDQGTALAGARDVGGTTTSVADATPTVVPDASVPVPSSLSDLYERLTTSLRGLDGVYHAVRTRTPNVGAATTTEVWVDARRDLGRLKGPGGEALVSGGVASGTAAAPSCHGAPVVVTLVLDCALTIHDNGSAVVSGGTLAGVPVVTVTSKGNALPTGGPEPELVGTYFRTVVLDAATLLPVRVDVRGDAVGEVPFATDSTVTVEWETLPVASYPDAFFTTPG